MPPPSRPCLPGLTTRPFAPVLDEVARGAGVGHDCGHTAAERFEQGDADTREVVERAEHVRRSDQACRLTSRGRPPRKRTA